MALAEIPQAKSLQVVTSYTNNDGKSATRKSTYSDVRLDATPDSLNAAADAIFALKGENMNSINTIVTNRLVNV